MDIATPTNLNINIIVADRTYPMKVKPDEEEIVRNAAKQVNEKVKEFQVQYGTNDRQDFLAMTALTYAVDLHKNEVKAQQGNSQLSSKLDQLDKTLDNFLGQNEAAKAE